MKDKILLADDEKDLARATKMILQYSGYEVDVVYNGKEAVEKAKEKDYNLIILDIMMPVMDGIEALKNLRKENINTPVILLTAKAGIDDKVDGLDAGANDYLTKPFNKKELLARIRAHIRNKEDKEQKYKIGNILYDKASSEISSNKATLPLSNKECELIEFLIKNQEKKVASAELHKRIWQDEETDESIVPMYISYIQDKFSALDASVKINNENNEYKLESILWLENCKGNLSL